MRKKRLLKVVSIFFMNMKFCFKCKQNVEKGKSHKCKKDIIGRPVTKSLEVTNVWKSKRWLKIRQYVLSTYAENGCSRCKALNKQLQLHHIVKVRDDITKAYDIENVCLLCSSCHNWTDENMPSGQLDFKFKRYEYKYNI